MDEEKCPSLLDTLDFLKLPDFKLIPEPQKKIINFLYKDSDSELESDSYSIPDQETASEESKMSGGGHDRLEEFEREMIDFEENNEYDGEEYKEMEDQQDAPSVYNQEIDEDEEMEEDKEMGEDQDMEENEKDEEMEEDESESVSDYNSELIEFDKINDFVENIKEFIEQEKGKNILVKLIEKSPLTYELIVNGNDTERVILNKDLSRKKIKKIIEVIDYIIEYNKK